MQGPPSLFTQITSCLFAQEFSRCTEQFPTTRATRGLSEYDHFLALCFGQLTYRESLRDIVACLRSKKTQLYHLGFRGDVSRTNLAYANQHRDWRMFQAVAEILMRKASRLYQNEDLSELPKNVFALDSTIISLSLALFPWGYYSRQHPAAVKLHIMLSLKGNLPAWAAITEAQFPDMKILDQVPILPGAFLIMDRGYIDFIRLYKVHLGGGFFVVRNKHHVVFRVIESRPVDKSKGLKCDQTIRLTSNWSVKSYPEILRRVRVYDEENKVTIDLLTNNFQLSAQVIADLYRHRWKVELFFKWIKQHLKIRSFYGRSPNAVRCQIWTAIGAYLMVAILKKQLNTGKSLYEILQIVSINIFEKTPLDTLLNDDFNNSEPIEKQTQQPNLL